MTNEKKWMGEGALDKLIALIHALWASVVATITANKTAADTGIQEAKDAVTAETTRATAAEEANAAAITAEQTRAEAAEKANADNITTLQSDLSDLEQQVKDHEDLLGDEMTADYVQQEWDKVFGT